MNAEVCKQVRKWLRTGPGMFEGPSPHAVYQAAWGASGLQVSLGDMTDAMHAEGFRPVPGHKRRICNNSRSRSSGAVARCTQYPSITIPVPGRPSTETSLSSP